MASALNIYIHICNQRVWPKPVIFCPLEQFFLLLLLILYYRVIIYLYIPTLYGHYKLMIINIELFPTFPLVQPPLFWEDFSTQFWNGELSVCVHSQATREIAKMSGEPSFLSIPKVFSRVKLRELCRTLKFFHFAPDKPCLHGCLLVPVTGNLLNNCVPTHVIIRFPHTYK